MGNRNTAEGGGAPGGDGIPPLVQYKLLRAMQTEINKKTEDFARQHPDVKKLSDGEAAELKALQNEQKEIADLLDDIAQPPPEGDKP